MFIQLNDNYKMYLLYKVSGAFAHQQICLFDFIEFPASTNTGK